MRIKIIELKQKDNKKITDYVKRINDLIRKMLSDDIEINIIIFRKMRKLYKKEQISFECNKNVNYSFINVQKLVKAVYNEINKSNLFDSEYNNSIRVVLLNNRLVSFQIDVIYQVILNQNQILLILLNDIRHLLINQ